MELSGYFAVARRWWWTLLVAAWVAGLAGFYVASRLPKMYESSVEILVGPINTDAATVGASARLIQTDASLVTSGPVLNDVVKEQLDFEISPGLIAASTRVSANVESRILTIRVEADDATKAAAIANGIANVLQERTSAGLARPEGMLTIIDPAVPDPYPVAPQVSLIVLLATAAGILAALILVLMIEYLSRTVSSREELAKLAGAPVLGSVPAPRKSRADPRDLVDEGSSAANVYRVLAARIVFGDPDAVLHSMAIVDAESDTGAAIVAINLGRALARLGRRAVVIDSGSRSNLAELYRIEPAPGIRDVLSREVQPRAAMRIVSDRLAIIPAGYEGGDAIDPERARTVIQELLASADVVVVATPPVHAGPGALSWARAVGRTVLVARRDHARREDIETSAETLVHVGGSLIGTVMSERPAALSWLFGRGRSRSADPIKARPNPSNTANPVSQATQVSQAAQVSPPSTSDGYRSAASTATPAGTSNYTNPYHQPTAATPSSTSGAPTASYAPTSPTSYPASPVVSTSSALAPSTIRPTVIRASAPVPPPPVAPSSVIAPPPPADVTASSTPAANGTTRSTSAKPRSTTTKPRATRSTAPKNQTDSL